MADLAAYVHREMSRDVALERICVRKVSLLVLSILRSAGPMFIVGPLRWRSGPLPHVPALCLVPRQAFRIGQLAMFLSQAPGCIHFVLGCLSPEVLNLLNGVSGQVVYLSAAVRTQLVLCIFVAATAFTFGSDYESLFGDVTDPHNLGLARVLRMVPAGSHSLELHLVSSRTNVSGFNFDFSCLGVFEYMSSLCPLFVSAD